MALTQQCDSRVGSSAARRFVRFADESARTRDLARIEGSVWNIVRTKKERERERERVEAWLERLPVHAITTTLERGTARRINANDISTFQREPFPLSRIVETTVHDLAHLVHLKPKAWSGLSISRIYLERFFPVNTTSPRVTISIEATPRSFRVCYRNGKYRYRSTHENCQVERGEGIKRFLDVLWTRLAFFSVASCSVVPRDDVSSRHCWKGHYRVSLSIDADFLPARRRCRCR